MGIDKLNDSDYVFLSSTYAKGGRLHDVSRVRTKLKEIGIQKKAGCSLPVEFTCGDFSNPQSAEIYSMLNEIEARVHEEELKEGSSFYHSEKLAVAYGLICL
ncbi:unnamed protein product [Ilex paraguariensis]|uniref:Uncharacterized protein n=1 Tax=Ilex paraguariensis TaxID=185542 RepID=A0ABC8T570_9AQUA